MVFLSWCAGAVYSKCLARAVIGILVSDLLTEDRRRGEKGRMWSGDSRSGVTKYVKIWLLLAPYRTWPQQSLEDFTANPDMVEEFFYLVGRVVDYCPEPLVSR